MKTTFCCAALLTFCPANAIADDARTNADEEPGGQFAAHIEQLLSSLKETKYQGTTDIDEAKGKVNCDCSGLIGYTLRQRFPEAYVSLEGDEAAWRKRPVSVTYYQTFVHAGEKSNGCWRRVKKLTDAVPGDILAWRKKTLKEGSTTGHTCMIAGAPRIVGNGKVRVRIIDSTRSPHEDDTRGKHDDGMGAGFKTFLVDADGNCVGYMIGDREIQSRVAIGRLVQPKVTTSHTADAGFIGLATDKAIALAKQRGRSYRIIREDGKTNPPKWLIRDVRLNFVIKAGNVTHVFRG